jgi:PAS domain S-box-containing protein
MQGAAAATADVRTAAAVMDAVPDLVMCIDGSEGERGTIVSVNAAAHQMLGFKPAEMLGHNYFDFMDMSFHTKVSPLCFARRRWLFGARVAFAIKCKRCRQRRAAVQATAQSTAEHCGTS